MIYMSVIFEVALCFYKYKGWKYRYILPYLFQISFSTFNEYSVAHLAQGKGYKYPSECFGNTQLNK
jgi:hypothetical protein